MIKAGNELRANLEQHAEIATAGCAVLSVAVTNLKGRDSATSCSKCAVATINIKHTHCCERGTTPEPKRDDLL